MNKLECSFCHEIFLNAGARATHELWCNPNNKKWQEEYRIKQKKLLKEKNFKNIERKRHKNLSDIKLKKSNPNLIKNFFEDINTEKKAYWLGFLYGDGTVSKKSRRLSLSLKVSDIKHLKKFKKILKARNKIQITQKSKMCRFVVHCEELVDDLIKLGCIPNKSLQLNNLPNISNNLMNHFIRGLFDADGCIQTKIYILFTLTGNKKFIFNINKYIVKNKIVNHYNKLIVYKKNKNTVNMNYGGKYAIQIFNWIYNNSNIYLERKYEKFKEYHNKKS